MINKRIIFIFLLTTIAIGTLSAVNASDTSADMTNSSYALQKLDESIDLSEDTPLESSKFRTFTELQNQINNAPKDSTIYLTDDYHYTTDFKSRNGITITKSITIDGKGHAIDGMVDSPLLLINKADNVVLKNIVFQKGYNEYSGIVSAIYSNNIRFENCKFIDNEADTGTVFLGGNNYTSFVNCIFEENYAYGMGGAVYMAQNRYPSFVNCHFYLNEALSGGAIYSRGNYRPSFELCCFEGNSADDGGAILSNRDESPLYAECKFLDNACEYYGGAIYLTENNETAFNSCNFSGNYGYYGGTLSANNTDIYINFCNFAANTGYNGTCIFSQESNVHCRGSFFNTSDMANIGGAICSIHSALDIADCKFSENFAFYAGGDIYSKYGMVFLENNTFYNSTCLGFGGSLCFNDDYVQLKNCIFDECTSLIDGGGAIYCLNSVLYSHSCEYVNCNSDFGGAVCSLNTELEIKDSRFVNNSAFYSGGSLYTIYGSLSLDNSTFLLSSSQNGGAAYIRSPQKINNITNNRFLYSSAKKGSKIYVDEYYGDIPQSGNVFEDIYFAVGLFNGSNANGEEYCNYSNILTYVVSNANGYHSDLSYYAYLRDEFASDMNFTPIESENIVDVNIHDEDNPNDQIIFINYDDYSNRTIIYDSQHSRSDLNLRFLDIQIYNFNGDDLTSLKIMSVIGNINSEDYEKRECLNTYTAYDNRKTRGWWVLPVFENNTRVTINEDRNGVCYWYDDMNYSELDINGIDGKLIFNFEDRKLDSNFGNVYEFKKEYNSVPLINYTSNITYLPKIYDSRDYGYITKVQNQENGKNCWAFAGIATLEACLKKATGQTYDFSENNAKNMMAVTSIYGLNIDSNAGGYDTMFMGYLASWLGPADEEYDVYNPLSSLSEDLYPVYYIQDIAFLPARQNTSDNYAIKNAIINSGAVCVIFDWTVNNISNGLHTVSLIGWNDEYNGIDCLGNYAKGAWIFKNSWGDEWGDNGFGYLSYEQKLSEEIAPYMHTYTFIFNEADIGYQEIYQYDFAGLTDFLCTNTTQIYYKNKFTAKDEEFLSAFSTYFEKPTYFTYTVTINGKEVAKSEKIYSQAGYHTIRLDEYLLLNKSNEFEIIIKLIDANIPVCQADELYKQIYPSNVSFFSYNSKDWMDLNDLTSQYNFSYTGAKANTSQVACIKAFTTTSRMDYTPLSTSVVTPLGTRIGSTYDMYNLNVVSFKEVPLNKTVFISMNIPEWGENETYEQLVEIKINGETYYSKINGGKSVLKISFDKEGNYTFSAKLKSNYYYSRPVTFDFVVTSSVTDVATTNTLTELHSMIFHSDAGDVINLTDDYYYDVNFQDVIVIDHSLTIEGNGHTINCLSKSGLFQSDDDCEVTLRNINIIGANESSIIAFGNLNIYNCTFSDNEGAYGGAVYCEGQLTVSDSIFKSNYCYVNGGAIISYGPCNIENSLFESNRADKCGGALAAFEYMNITNCKFINNTGDLGGAVYSLKEGFIDNTLFKSNSADNGGALYTVGENKIENSIFESTTAQYGGAIISYDYVDVIKCNFKNNSATYNGGSFYSNDKLNIEDSMFESNSADTQGGALAAYENINITNCKFINNTGNMGGAVYSLMGGFIDNTVFKSNSADDGGALYTVGKNKIENSIFESNTAQYGGAILCENDLNITNCDFKNNSATDNGGALSLDGDSIIKNSKFNSNSAIYGGAICSGYDAPTKLINCEFTNDLATEYGGSIFSESTLEISNSNFKSNLNREAILFYAHNPTSQLYLKNNKMEMGNENAAAIWYTGYCPYDSPLYLVFSNISAVKGNNVSLARLVNDDGNTFTVSDLNFTLTNKNNKEDVKNLKIKYTRELGGYILNTSDIDLGEYELDGNLSDDSLVSYTVKTGTLKIVKPAVLTSSGLEKVYGTNAKLTVTLKDDKGNAIANTNVKVKISGKTYTIKTNSKGQASLAINLAPNTYSTTITFEGNSQYSSASCQVKVVIKKATPKLTANKKTFKVSAKTKKYTITLKNNLGKVMKNTKVTIKVNGKTYTVKTNSKGQATFTLKITKKGTYKATIKYNGDKYYNSVTKTATITVKK